MQASLPGCHIATLPKVTPAGTAGTAWLSENLFLKMDIIPSPMLRSKITAGLSRPLGVPSAEKGPIFNSMLRAQWAPAQMDFKT